MSITIWQYGRVASVYHENPYYTTIYDIMQNQVGMSDEILVRAPGVWSNTTVVYGPLWTMICSFLSAFPTNQADILLMVYKLANLVIHMCNCLLLYKITRKKIFPLIYGLNPLVLLEGLINVHNDIFVLFFILLAIYFVYKKKNLYLAVTAIAFATLIKYFAIFLLPFMILYYYQDRKIKERIGKLILFGVFFVIIVIAFYLIYLQDLAVLQGLFVQQEKYCNSLWLIAHSITTEATLKNTKLIMLGAVVILYILAFFKMLRKETIKFSDVMKNYTIFLLLFLFILITNFQPWYLIWLFSIIPWLKGKNLKTILALTIAADLSNIYYMIEIFNQTYSGHKFFFSYLILTIGISLLLNKRKKNTIKAKVEQKKIGGGH